MADRSSGPRRTVAVVALGPRPLAESDLSGIERLTRAGVHVRLVSWTAPRPRLASLLDDIVVVGPGRRSVPMTESKGSDGVAEPPADVASLEPVEPAAPPLEEGEKPASPPPAPLPPPPPRPPGPLGVFVVGVRAVRAPDRYWRRAQYLARRRMLRMRRLTAARTTLRNNVRRLRSQPHTAVATIALARNRRARSLLTASGALVAADLPSVLAVWAVARRRSGVPALFGVLAATSRITPAPAPGATRVTGPRPEPDRSARTRR
jgi:hypothetical protein